MHLESDLFFDGIHSPPEISHIRLQFGGIRVVDERLEGTGRADRVIDNGHAHCQEEYECVQSHHWHSKGANRLNEYSLSSDVLRLFIRKSVAFGKYFHEKT